MSNRPNRQKSHSARVKQASQSGGSGNTVLWIALAVIVVVAGLVAIAVTRGSGDSEGGGSSPSGGTVVPNGELHFGQVDVEGTPLPPATSGGPDAAVGMDVPTISGRQFDDSPITIDADGPTIVLGLAHWCPHCRNEVPRLQDWLDDNGMPSDVELVAVATGTDEGQLNFPPGRWLRNEGWSVPTLVDDQEDRAGGALGISGFPAFIVVGPDGTVVQRASGELRVEQWEQLLEAARTGRPAT